MPYPDLLASGETLVGTFVPFELMAGESKIVDDQGVAGAVALAQFAVVMRDVGDTLVVWDGTPGTAIAVTMQPILPNASGPIRVGGIFNHQALIWPVGVTTLAARKAAFDGTMIGVRQLL